MVTSRFLAWRAHQRKWGKRHAIALWIMSTRRLLGFLTSLYIQVKRKRDVYMYVCVFVWVCMCVSACVCTCKYAFKHVCIFMCMYIQIFTSICMFRFSLLGSFPLFLCFFVRICVFPSHSRNSPHRDKRPIVTFSEIHSEKVLCFRLIFLWCNGRLVSSGINHVYWLIVIHALFWCCSKQSLQQNDEDLKTTFKLQRVEWIIADGKIWFSQLISLYNIFMRHK